MDREEEWIRAHVEPIGPKEVVRERVWATTWRLPTTEGVVWFKADARTHRLGQNSCRSLPRVGLTSCLGS